MHWGRERNRTASILLFYILAVHYVPGLCLIPPGFKPNPRDELFYRFYDEANKNLFEAMKICQESGAQLAFFKSPMEYDAVMSQIGEFRAC